MRLLRGDRNYSDRYIANRGRVAFPIRGNLEDGSVERVLGEGLSRHGEGSGEGILLHVPSGPRGRRASPDGGSRARGGEQRGRNRQ